MLNFSTLKPLNPKEMQHTASKRYGQNFLIDPNMIHQLVEAMHIHSQDAVVEIGPGLGALTRPLLQKLVRFTAIELDQNLLAFLSTLEGLTVIHQDVLTLDFSTLTEDLQHLRVVGNLPYNISTPIIFHLRKQRQWLKDMHFMLQKEVVERMSAVPNSKIYGRLSVMVQSFCQVTPLVTIPPECFRPMPKVMSQFVRLTPFKGDPFDIQDHDVFEAVVKAAFATRRKTLRNNLKGIIDTSGWISCEIDPQARAENLAVSDYARLSRYLISQNNVR